MKKFQKRKNFLIFGSPKIEEAEIQEVVKTLRAGWIGTGPKVARFEDDFRHYKKAYHAIAVNSGTAALHLSLIALGFQPGDEVITTPMTFCATLNAIIHAKLKPVLVDCERDSFNIDVREIERKITPRTRAIVPVHFAGRPCNMEGIVDLARRHNLAIVEDCAHAIETSYHGQSTGTFGAMGCFSFYVTKNITTAEGGMVLTGSHDYAARIKTLALHGLSKDAWKRFGDTGYKHYEVTAAGFKYNMTDLQASLGLHQLKRIERYYLKRKKLWDTYMWTFANLPCHLPSLPEKNTRHGYHLFTILADTEHLGKSRDQILQELTALNIGTGVHYTALHLHPFYRQILGTKKGDFPNAEFISERTFSIPLSAKLTSEDVQDVIAAVRYVLSK